MTHQFVFWALEKPQNASMTARHTSTLLTTHQHDDSHWLATSTAVFHLVRLLISYPAKPA
jgi:hypothetical protein